MGVYGKDEIQVRKRAGVDLGLCVSSAWGGLRNDCLSHIHFCLHVMLPLLSKTAPSMSGQKDSI